MTRREFDRLDKKVSDIDAHGTRELGLVKGRQADIRGDVGDLRRDMETFRKKLDKNTTALWGLAIVLLVGCIGIITALVTQQPG